MIQRLPQNKSTSTSLFLTDGSCRDLSKSFKYPIFYAGVELARAFRTKAVPSAVRQAAGYMEVTEIAVKEEK